MQVNLKQFRAALNYAPITSITVAMLSGKLTLSRLGYESTGSQWAEKAPWLELRLWFSILALVFIITNFVIDRRSPFFSTGARTRPILLFSVIVFFHAFLIAHTLVFGAPVTTPEYIADFAYVIVFGLVYFFGVRSFHELWAIAYVIEFIGALLMLLILLGFANSYEYGWAPYFGTTVSFYRVQLLAFCCALFGLLAAQLRSEKAVHALLALAFLFSSLASGSRANVAACFAIACYLCLALVILGELQRAITIGLIFSVAVVAFVASHSTSIATRFSADYPDNRTATGLVGSPAPTARSFQSDLLNACSDDLRCQRSREANSRYVRLASTMLAELAFPASKSIAEKSPKPGYVLVADPTTRIRLFFHAWQLFSESISLGAGMGKFRVVLSEGLSENPGIFLYPHNIILELLASTGLVGTILFGVALFMTVAILHQAIRVNSALLPLVGYALGIFVSAMFAGDVYDFRTFFLSAIVVACATDWRLLAKSKA